MAAKRPTQKDIAKHAGVSQATVSMAVNGTNTESLSPETLAKIHAVARELGYQPNRFAQALKTRRTMSIACMVPDITNPFYPDLIRGVQKMARDRGYDVIAVNTEGEEKQEKHFLDWATQGRVDGVIGVFFTQRAKDLAQLVTAGVPVVRIESSKKKGGPIAVDDIYVDSHAASVEVTEYLLAKGHSRIAMVAGNGGPQKVRIDGYCSVLKKAKLKPLIILDEDFNEKGGLRAAEKLLRTKKRPTAVFAANDLMAIGLMMAFTDKGLDIPHDIAVVGFDDILAARLVSPRLSTVSQFQENMGKKAVEILIDRLNGTHGDGKAVEMPYQFIQRGSA